MRSFIIHYVTDQLLHSTLIYLYIHSVFWCSFCAILKGLWFSCKRLFQQCQMIPPVTNFISCVFWHQISASADSPAARPSPSQSSSQPAQQTQQTDSLWQTPRASAQGQWWCLTWRQCFASPTRGESLRRGHGAYSRCYWLVWKLWREKKRLGNNIVSFNRSWWK